MRPTDKAIFAAGLNGGMLFPWAVGHISTHFGLRSLIVPLAGAIGISIVHWLLSWRLSSERLAKRLKTPYPFCTASRLRSR
ncbi:MAG: hypothetical protein ACXW29_05815 [Thermoanaerobaculia bacterium]